MATLNDVAEQILASSVGKHDYTSTVQEVAKGLFTLDGVKAGDETYALSPAGFKTLVRDRMGIPPNIFAHKSLSLDTKLGIIREVAKDMDDTEVRVRVTGNQISSIASAEYAIYDNSNIALELMRLQRDGNLPKGVEVMNSFVSKNGRSINIRLISPKDWDFKIGENGNTQPFLGNLVIHNDELSLGSFQARVAITRAACLNTTVGNSIFDAGGSRFASRDDFTRALGEATSHIKNYSQEMIEGMKSLQAISVQSPLLIFEKVAKDLKIPQYAIKDIRQYWEDNGNRNSVYDVVQAVSAGVRDITNQRGQNWARRQSIEREIWNVGQAIRIMHTEGRDVDDWYLTGDLGIKEMCARFVEGYVEDIPQAENIADGIRQLEFNID